MTRSLKKHGPATLLLEYENLDEYLFLLRQCCEAIASTFPQSVIYLAAAVSDFYVPAEKMVSYFHKEAEISPLKKVVERFRLWLRRSSVVVMKFMLIAFGFYHENGVHSVESAHKAELAK